MKIAWFHKKIRYAESFVKNRDSTVLATHNRPFERMIIL